MSLNLYQRINEIRKKVGYIKKDQTVSTGGSSYKAVTHDHVCSITREHMIEFGVVCIPSLVSSKSNPPHQIQGQDKINKQWRYEAIYDFKFINADDPKEFEVVRVEGHGLDSGDKAPGKALSMCRKYASLKIFEIASGDEEENVYSEKEDFDIDLHISLLSKCKDIKELEAQYKESKKLATEAKDPNAITKINRKTVEIKESFLKESK